MLSAGLVAVSHEGETGMVAVSREDPVGLGVDPGIDGLTVAKGGGRIGPRGALHLEVNA